MQLGSTSLAGYIASVALDVRLFLCSARLSHNSSDSPCNAQVLCGATLSLLLYVCFGTVSALPLSGFLLYKLARSKEKVMNFYCDGQTQLEVV